MKRWVVLLLGVLLAVGFVVQVSGATSSEAKIIEFDTMAGVRGPFVGTANPIRGVNGAGLPWQIAQGEGELRTDGDLKVEVRGLVLLDGPPVPLALRGTNPSPFFRAIVSCLTITGSAPATANLTTGLFPATPTGDAEIEATVSVPSPCFAPIVFVTSPTGSWFAVTGQQ